MDRPANIPRVVMDWSKAYVSRQSRDAQVRSLQESELSHLPQQEENQGKTGSQKVLFYLPKAHASQREENLICILYLVYSISYREDTIGFV